MVIDLEKWFIKNKKDPKIDYSKFGLNKILYKILINRDIKTEEEFKNYLNPKLDDLNSPILLKDLIKASNLVLKAIDNNEKIRIIGDYDVDGVTSTYILFTGLKRIGGDVSFDIPHRVIDGYGINKRLIDECVKDNVDLIITCDNGIAATSAVDYAKDNNIKVVITDHHEVPKISNEGKFVDILPNADAIIDPKREDDNYPFSNICGAVVAFKLIEYLFLMKGIDKEEFFERFLPFAAIATVCDVMPLKDENRIIVKYGLDYLRETKHFGLNALIEAASIDKDTIDIYHIGFIIGPTLNSSGRLESAKEAIDLLLEIDYSQALEKAQKLRNYNSERQDLTNEALEIIDSIIKREDLIDKYNILIVYAPNLNESILGIVAGKIKEKYNRPTIVLSDSNNLLKGSGRSIEEYDMFTEISKSKTHLESFGGHKMACGLSLSENNLMAFIDDVNKNENLTSEDLVKKIYIDAPLPLKFINLNFAQDLEKLAPFGQDNPKPQFGAKNLKIDNLRIFGKNKNVIKMSLIDNNSRAEALLFEDSKVFLNKLARVYGRDQVLDLLNGIESNIYLDIVFNIGINEFRGNVSTEMRVKSYRVIGE